MVDLKKLKTNLSDEKTKRKLLVASGNFGYKFFRFLLLSSMCFIILYPVIYMFSVAIRQSVDLYDPTVIWIPKHFTLDNFSLVIETLDYFKLLVNTLWYSAVSTLLSVASCALAGYGFARFNFKFKGLLFTLLLFTIIVPPQIVSIPLYLQYADFDFFGITAIIKSISGADFKINLLDTPLTLFIPALLGAGLRSGFLIYVFRQFFRGMPAALEDAAYIDGCGVFSTFLKIIVPNASGSFLVVSLLSFVWYYNDYFFTSMYFSKVPTVSVGLASLQGMLRAAVEGDQNADPYSIIAQMQAGCLLAIIPLTIAFLFLQKKFIKSIESSGIVG